MSYRIVGIFRGYNFRGNAFRKVFADLIFVIIVPFLQHVCMRY